MFLIGLVLAMPMTLLGQECPGHILTTQSQIDEYLIGNPSCETVTGDLIFDGIDIEQIGGFNSIKEIEGDLVIANTSIPGLHHAFQNLTSVGGDLIIEGNLDLGFVNEFEKLETIGGDLYIAGNDAMFLLAGFDVLKFINNSMEIRENNLLAEIPDFGHLTRIGFSLVMRENGLLSEVKGFKKLKEVAEDIRIVANPNLSYLGDFPSLEVVGDDLTIEENDPLERIVGFDYLISIGDNLNIERNDNLLEIIGFRSLKYIDDDVDLKDNPVLQKIDALDNLIRVLEDIEIQNNPMLKEVVGLNHLEKVRGLIIQQNDELLRIDGFVDLDSVCQDLMIDHNDKLEYIRGFTQLHFIGRDFIIEDNVKLGELKGLQSLQYVNGEFSIRNNRFSELLGFVNLTFVGEVFEISEPELISLGSFARLKVVGNNLILSNNPALKEIHGFNALGSIGADLRIEFNSSLKHISGFSNLITLNDDLLIRNNDHLVHIKGFESLTDVVDELQISDNPLLESVFAFSNLSSVDDLVLTNNPSLFYCCGFTHLLSSMGYNNQTIFGNAPGCNTEAEILAICDATLSDCNPNCVGQLNAAIDRYGVAVIRPSDFVLDTMGCNAGLEISVENQWGGIIFGPQLIGMNGAFPLKACALKSQKSLKLVARSTQGTCWTDLTFKDYITPNIPSDTVKTVLCTDPLINGPLPGTIKPAWIPCTPEQQAVWVTDWIQVIDCDPGVNDTVKVIYREWEAFGKNGHRGVAFDTIIVLQFPEIVAENIYCEDKDTLYCGDTTLAIGPYITYDDPMNGCQQSYLITAQDLDNDGMLEFVPNQFDPLCGLTVFVDYTKFDGQCEINYRVEVEIKQECYGPPSLSCVVPVPAGTPPNAAEQLAPGYWRCEFWVVDLDTLAPMTYCKGDPLFTGNFDESYFNFFSSTSSSGGGIPVLAGLLQDADPTDNIDLEGLPYALKINSRHAPIAKFDVEADQPDVASAQSFNAFFPYPYYSNAVLSHQAQADGVFAITWDFTLAPIQDDFAVNQTFLPINGSQGAAVSVFYSLNGKSFRLVEGEPFEGVLTAEPAVSNLGVGGQSTPHILDPVTVSASQTGILNLPLRKGDQLFIVAFWDSPSEATLRLMGQNVVSTNQNDCEAHAYLPPIYAADDWSGVKQVKASVEDIGTLVFNNEDSCWVSHERLKLNKRAEPYKVIYEIFDSCHNKTYDSCYVIVKDLIKPVPVIEKGLTVNLSGKKIWVDASTFDEGTVDNCGLNYLFVRRADWYESCIDLCDSLVPLCVPEHDDTIFMPYLTLDKRIDEVEAHYARFLAWLRYEGEECHELLFNAWQYDLIKYANSQCFEHEYDLDDHLLRDLLTKCAADKQIIHEFESIPTHLGAETYYPFDNPVLMDTYRQLGGGWSDAVPFDCTDACGPVTVEVLAMDYWCNWSTAWTTVWVEDKTALEIDKNLVPEVDISCKTYRDKKFTYADQEHSVSLEYLVEQAKLQDEDAFAALDQIFGGYQKAWRGPYGGYFDADGDTLECDLLLVDSICVCTTYTEPVRVYHEHEGYIWKDSVISKCYYKPDTLRLKQGVVVSNCAPNVQCQQEVWCDIDHCGEGYIYRKFKIWSNCGEFDTTGLSDYDIRRIDSAQHATDTLTRQQRIRISNRCDLSKYMFEIPPDTTIDACQVTYDAQGNVSGLAAPEITGEAKYKFDDDCRLVGIAHDDRVFKIVGGDEGCYKILRTWYFADWCGYGESTDPHWWKDYDLVVDSCVQKIIIFDTIPPECRLFGPVASGENLEVGTCDYNLEINVEASDACGFKSLNWELKDITGSPMVVRTGEEPLGDDPDIDVQISLPSLPHGRYKLVVRTVDECNNEGYCEYEINIVAVKKPTAICISSLTTRLVPWDSNQDGIADTAKSIIWAEEFDVSSLPACQDTAIEFRIELIDDFEDDIPAGDADSLVVGCGQLGSNLVRLWVRSLPSMTTDYCDVVLIVQSDFEGCSEQSNVSTSELKLVAGRDVQAIDHVTKQGAGSLIINGIGDHRPSDLHGPVQVGLYQNVPNPFSTHTSIAFTLPSAMAASITIYRIDGQILKSYRGTFVKGLNTVEVLSSDLTSSGVLLYRLVAGEIVHTRKMVYLN